MFVGKYFKPEPVNFDEFSKVLEKVRADSQQIQGNK
jgi:hypothetical protein